MIGQKLQVAVLLDSDKAGDDAREKLVKRWLTRYHSNPAHVLGLAECVGKPNQQFAIEDLFPDEYYLERVKQVYAKQLAAAGVKKLGLAGTDLLCKRVERSLEKHGIAFNKGSVAKVLRADLCQLKDTSELPAETREMAKKIFQQILQIFPRSLLGTAATERN